MQNQNETDRLLHSTWKRLVELTSYISEDQFNHLMSKVLKIQSLDQLSEEQALDLIDHLSVLPKLKSNLYHGIQESTEQIVQRQLDIFAEQLITGNGNNVDV